MFVIRQLDLLVLAVALIVFLAAGLPIAGWATGAGAWVVQRAVREVLSRRAAAADEPRTVAGLMVASMIGRGWLMAGAIFVVGLNDNSAGLAAAVLVVVLFTTYFTTSIFLRPFDPKAAGARPGRDGLSTGKGPR